MEVRIRKQLAQFALDVSFQTGEGVFALLGASGSGKSMTLKCIAGIERPDEGRIELGGRVLFDSERGICLPPQKRRVGYMFQDYALFPNMTVRQNVMAGMPMRKEDGFSGPDGKSADGRGRRSRLLSGVRRRERYVDEDRLESILRQFHIDELQEEYPARLSGGQKQRVAMARLVAQDPDVILLDEPFSALDTHLRWQLEQEMRNVLRDMHRPAVIVSHDRDEVFHLCDTVCCLHRGHVEVIEPVRDFFTNPETKEAAILSGCKNVADAVRIDRHRLYIPSYGITITLSRDIPEDVTAVGIRAHSFSAVEKDGGMPLPVLSAVPREDPFEWTVFFRCAEGADMMQWKISKGEMPSVRIPERLALPENAVMLLRS